MSMPIFIPNARLIFIVPGLPLPTFVISLFLNLEIIMEKFTLPTIYDAIASNAKDHHKSLKYSSITLLLKIKIAVNQSIARLLVLITLSEYNPNWRVREVKRPSYAVFKIALIREVNKLSIVNENNKTRGTNVILGCVINL